MQIVPNFRVRTIPVLGTMPAIFGMAAASYILCQLAQLPIHPEPIFKLVEGQYETQLQRLAEREDLVYGNSEGPAVDLDDVSSASVRWPPSLCGAVLCTWQVMQGQREARSALCECEGGLTPWHCWVCCCTVGRGVCTRRERG